MSMLGDIAVQLRRLQETGFDKLLSQEAEANGLEPAFFFAIASRETNCVNKLGDVQADGAHGVGIVQVDIQHPNALEARNDGSWQTNPAPLIALGAQLLAENIRQAQQALPLLNSDQQLKVAASGYNCGVTRAIAAVKGGQDSDLHTTGRNYGADVMARKALFEGLMAEEQSAISNQQSVVSNQQSVVSNQQSVVSNQQSVVSNRELVVRSQG